MKQTTVIIATLFMSSFIVSCENTSNEKSEEQAETLTHEEIQHNNEVQTLELNDGEKWTVNTEMKPFVINGAQLVNNYVTNNSNDYKALTTRLEEENNRLISSCTMDGKSHEVLHEWLHPHLELVKKLSKAETNEEVNEIVEQLKKSYELYSQYFQ